MRYSSGALVKLVVLCLVFTYLTPLVAGDGDEDESKTASRHSRPQVIASHCSDKCGNITIPYPFGTKDGCFYQDYDGKNTSSFKINCTDNVPIFGKNFGVSNISVAEGELQVKGIAAYDCYNKFGDSTNRSSITLNLRSFTLSNTKNIVVAVGCDTYVFFEGQGRKNYSTGCTTTCVRPEDVTDGRCSGIGCCEAPFPIDSKHIRVRAGSFNNHTSVSDFNPCSAAFPVKRGYGFRQNLSLDDHDYDDTTYPVVIDWAIPRKTCSEAEADNTSLCGQNADCHDLHHRLGYRCKCKSGFEGNAYLRHGHGHDHDHGCMDIDECKKTNECEKEEYCVNTIGSYHCKCPKGHDGNGTKADRCTPTNPWLTPVLATAGASVSIITILVIGFLFYRKHKERQLKKTRDSFFQQNGGLLLHEKLSSLNNVDTFKIFTTQDLENASNNYCDDNIIGRGGFGMVYKGILPNKQIVAIKKSLRVDPSQVEHFINEVLILSQIKNKYVVKLLGCCLEAEVPLLVYEFINNGTLYDHLHNEVKASILTWPIRLKIASQVADVLSYLHDTIATPIIHRDMKSMNILLDESYTAKVADFGASRLTPSDQSQFATLVIGTRGYLDPEYLQTGKLTKKSDVYSFGVVLVELLTREKAISFEVPEIEKYLTMNFLVKMRDGCLSDILDKNIVSDNGTFEQLQQVANLANWCLNLKGEKRPTMKEVSLELETIKRKGSYPWNDDSGSLEDCESFLADYPRLDDYGGCSFDIESNVYDS